MLRYAAALTMVLLSSLVFADSLDPSRDANLRLFSTTCLLVDVQSHNSSLTAAAPDIATTLMNKAILYSVPVKAPCTSDNLANMPGVLVRIDALSSTFDYTIQVVLPFAVWGPTGGGTPKVYSEAVVWEESGITESPSKITPQDIKDEAGKLFDDFALAWKKQHAK